MLRFFDWLVNPAIHLWRGDGYEGPSSHFNFVFWLVQAHWRNVDTLGRLYGATGESFFTFVPRYRREGRLAFSELCQGWNDEVDGLDLVHYLQRCSFP